MNDQNRDENLVQGIDVLGLIRIHGRLVLTAAIGATALVAVAAVIYLLWGQSTRTVFTLEFRPTFAGATAGTYPNGLVFQSSDIVAGTIADLVYDANGVTDYCSRESFRGGFFVEQRSEQSEFLDSDYQARLSDTRISGVERQRLLDEYEAKRSALPLQYRLVFVKPSQCDQLPAVVITKSMSDMLTTWALESEQRRGVLNQQVEVLPPALLDVGTGSEPRLIRAELLRIALERIITNIDRVSRLPGAGLIRLGEGRTTFLEIRHRLVDLSSSKLEPLVYSAAQSSPRESVTWLTEMAASVEREQQATEGKALTYDHALQQYSGFGTAGPPARALPGSSPSNSGEVQTLAAQIDRSFVDRIVELSDSNTSFRQDLTLSMVEARITALSAQSRAGYYNRLLSGLRGGAGSGSVMTPAEIDRRLNDIVAQGKALTQVFGDLYQEFSRVSFRPAASMFHAEKPATTGVHRSFTSRHLLNLLVATFLLSMVAALGFSLMRARLTERA